MIIKNVPQYLNKSTDEKLLKAIEMLNAENVRVSSDDDGNAGVVKTIKGNTHISEDAANDGDFISASVNVVGTITVPKKQYVLFFCHISVGPTHQIYLYDAVADTYKKLFSATGILTFNADSFVDAAVVFNSDDEAIVYFTDGEGEPNKINVDRMLTNRDKIWRDSTDSDYYSDAERKEFFAVCKTPPLDPITFTYATDSTSKSNNVLDKTFQFAYQYVYKDGEVSAISTYSKIAVNPNTYGAGVVEKEFERENNKIVLSYQNGGSEVESIRFLARLGGTTVFYKIGEVDNGTSASDTFDFTNDGMFPAVATTEVDKTFDNVPLKASTLSISGNRLVYGDYTESFDNVSIDVESSIVYQSKPASGKITATFQNNNSTVGPAIIIDGTAMEDSYPKGSVIRLKATLSGASNGKYRLTRSSGYLFTDTFDIGSNSGSIGYGNASTGFVDVPFTTSKVFSHTIMLGEEMTKDEILDEVADAFGAESDINYTFTQGASNVYNANGIVTAVSGGGSLASLNDDVQTAVDFTEININIQKDTSFSSTGKRRINLRLSTLKLEVHKDSNLRVVRINDDSNTITDSTATSVVTLTPSQFTYNASNISVSVGADDTFEAGITSFKTSAVHNFGIVYYDGKGRSSFVQKIDGVHVGGYKASGRGSNHGPVRIDLKIKHSPPTWAKKYQIVYGGNETYSNFMQFAVAGAHYKDSDEKIFLDLFPIEGKPASYSNDKGADLEYTYKEGDILRIISYNDSTQSQQYIDEQVFKVLGKEVVTTATDVTPNRASTFVVIRDEDYSLKTHNGFTLTKVKAGSDDWGQRVIVEILSPNTVNNDTVYYEIGEVYDISESNGQYAHVGDTTSGGYPVVQLTDGDVYFRPRDLLMAKYVTADSEYDEDDYDEYKYIRKYVESPRASDFYDSAVTSIGRPHAINDDAKQVRRRSSVTYSDPFIADSSVLGLSSFNATTANFSDFEIRHGKIDRLVDQTDRLYVFQENKVGIVGVNRNLLETLNDQNVVVSNVVFSTPNYYAGAFGSSGYPAAVVERFGMMYFVDVKAQRVLRISRDGITPISDPNMDSFFDSKFSTYLSQSGLEKMDIIAGFDPDNSEFILTSKDRGSYTGFTVAYSHNKRVFTSFYSFSPHMYAHLNDTFFSFKPVTVSGQTEIMWKHGASSSYGNFYGTDYDAKVTVVANANPSMVKAFQALSLEGDSLWSATVSTSDQTTSIATGDFDERERGYYAAIPRDTSASTANYITIGIVDDVTGTAVTFDNKINRMPIPLGAALYKVDGSSLTNLNATVSSIDGSKKLTTSTALTSSEEGKTIVAKLSAKHEGDVLRDYYAKIELTNSVHNKKSELYAVNTVFVDSPMHSALSQR